MICTVDGCRLSLPALVVRTLRDAPPIVLASGRALSSGKSIPVSREDIIL